MRQPGKGRTDAIFSTYDVARGDAYAGYWNNCRDLDGASPDFSNCWRIGGANQRKLLCCNDFSLIPGAPDADRVYPEFVWI
jgi:hypothetical protein